MGNFLAYRKLLEQSFLNFSWIFPLNISALLLAAYEENSKHSQISKIVINFQGKNSYFQGVPSALEKTFKILSIHTLFKEFKDLHEP